MRPPKPPSIDLMINIRLALLLMIGNLVGLPSFGQILNYDTHVIIDEKGQKTTEVTYLIQINSKESNWLSEVEIAHSPNQKLDIHYAQIIDASGNVVRKIKKKEIETRSNLSYSTFYQDDLISEFDLYWNSYPYQIAYSYTLEETEFVYACWWTPLVRTNVTTLQSSLKLTTPKDYEINIHQNSERFKRSESLTEDTKSFSWSYQNYSTPPTEIYSPQLRELIPLVSIVPNSFIYGVSGVSNSWASYGQWVEELNSGLDELTLYESNRIVELISGMEDEREIIRTLYHHLQDETSYVNVAIDVGGLQSYPASYVCKNKYGDCKALTTYMKALLKSAGISSNYVDIRAGKSIESIITSHPSQQFNHVILQIPLENDTIWLENTSNTLPFGYLGTFTQNRQALVVNGAKSQLFKTPELNPEDVLEFNKYVFEEMDDRSFRVSVGFFNGRVIKWKTLDTIWPISNKKSCWKILKVESHLKELKAAEWTLRDFHRDSVKLKLQLSGTTSYTARNIGKMRVINPIRVSIPDFEGPEKRTLNVQFSYPINRINESKYELDPTSFDRIQLPDETLIESDFGRYSFSVEQNGNSYTTKEHFLIHSGEIDIKDYHSFPLPSLIR